MTRHRLRNDPKLFSDDCDLVPRADDKYQPQVALFPEIKWERLQMINLKEYSDSQILAFTIANKADAMFKKGQLPLAIEFAFWAYKLDHLCVDALRVMCNLMLKIPQVDNDTISCCYREIIFTFREIVYNELLYKHPGDAVRQFKLRSYVRLLKDLAHAAILSERNEDAIYAYEEILRVDNEDYSGARFHLILCYLRVIGQLKRKMGPGIHRTMDHLHALLNCRLPKADGPLFENDDDKIPYRWLQMILAFVDNDNARLEKLAKEEQEKAPFLINFVFKEVKFECLQLVCMQPRFTEIMEFAEPLHFALVEWPEFLFALHDILREKDERFNNSITKFVPSMIEHESIEFKTQMSKIGFDFLERGRNSQRNREYPKSTAMFTMAKRYFVESMKPSHRWYLNAPFAVVSNRATCAETMKCWMLARHDTRFTLLLKHDHVRSYSRLPRIAEQFNAPELKKLLESFNEYVNSSTSQRSEKEWKEIADKAVALSSIQAIVYSRMGLLVPEKIDELIAIGVEDIYVSCNVDTDILPPLRWLADEPLECI